MRSNSTPFSPQGFATLISTVLLLSIVILITLYTATFKAQEQRIMRNRFALEEARHVAEAALEKTIQEIAADHNNLARTLTGTIAGGNYAALVSHVNYPNTPFGNVDVVEVDIVASSPGSTATKRSHQELVLMPLVLNKPKEPLVIKPAVELRGRFQIAEKPNFPDDLLDYMFGVPEANWQEVRELANVILPNCASLNTNTTGLVWVVGSCELSSNDVGSFDTPTLIVIQDGDFKMSGNMQLVGIAFQFTTPESSKKHSIVVNGGASVVGALMANQLPRLPSSDLAVRYSPVVLNNILVNDAFRRLFRVGGSWHDF